MNVPIKTADLYDNHAHIVYVAEPFFRDFGGRRAFHGPIATVQVFEDNVLVRAALETAGNGRILVVDGGGSLRCALVGDVLAQLAIDNGWTGIIVNGCIRDAAEIAQMPLGVKALAATPRKSMKKGAGQTAVPVTFAGVTFTPDHYLYADADGILVSAQKLD